MGYSTLFCLLLILHVNHMGFSTLAGKFITKATDLASYCSIYCHIASFLIHLNPTRF